MKRYWLSILILTAGLVFAGYVNALTVVVFLDIPSFIITVVTPFLFVTILFGFKEMQRAFTILRKSENEHDTLMSALAFFRVYGRATWLSAIIASFAGGIGIFSNHKRFCIYFNLVSVLKTLFFCGVVQLAIVIPYTVLIHKQLGNIRIRSDIFSIFGSLFGVIFAFLFTYIFLFLTKW